LELAALVKKKSYISVLVFSAIQIILAVLSLIGFFGYQSEGGAPSVKKTREQVQAWLDSSPSRQNLNVEIMGYDTRERELVLTVHLLQVWVLLLGVLSLAAAAVIFGMASHYRRQSPFQLGASPNVGPAAPSDQSGAGEGPPSVS
jgi:hypothetical protein